MKEHTTRRKFLRTATGCGAIAGLTALSNPGHATPVQSLSQTTGEPTVLLQQPLENPAGFAIHEGDFFIGAGENLLRVSVADGILWTESTASPVVDVTAIDGRILLGTDDGVEAFSPAGNQEWTRPLDGVNQLIRIGQGICVFSGDRTLAYISPDGTQQWETTVSGAEANISALISGSDDATIYAAVLERMSPRIIDENVNIDLFAINSDSGSIEFQETVVTESAHTDDLVELSEFNGEIYLAHEQNDVGLDQNARKMLYKYKDGIELWQTEARETYDFWSEGSNNYRIQTQPAANGDALYSQGPGDAIASFNTSDGTNQWTGAIIPRSIHATTEGVVFAGVDAGEPRLRRLQKNGVLDWDVTFGSSYSSAHNSDAHPHFTNLTPVPGIEAGYAVLDHYQDQLVVVGIPRQDDSQSGTTETPAESDDSTGQQTDDSQDESADEQSQDTPSQQSSSTSPDEAEQQQSSDQTERGVFFNGDSRIITQIDSFTMSVFGLALTIFGFLYQEWRD